MGTDLKLTSLIAPCMYPAHVAITDRTAAHYVLKGGRGSTKSTVAAIETVLALKTRPDCNALVMRKVAKTMRASVYAQVLWAIEHLGMASEFHPSVSPMQIEHKPTGLVIMFQGADDVAKLKSIKAPRGYWGSVWIEELDQFAGMAEIRSIMQSSLRGGDEFTPIYTYNPPRHPGHWVNVEMAEERPGRLVHPSCYLDVPPEWLGTRFIAEADDLKERDEDSYRHEYLGEAVGGGEIILPNVKVRPITKEERDGFKQIHNGVDWGYFPHPWVFLRCAYDAARRTVYIFDEITALKASNETTAGLISDRLDPPLQSHLIVCDSAESKSVAEYRSLGLNARGVKKGKGSVDWGVKWLQAQTIVIDGEDCPLSAKQFTGYEYAKTRGGEYSPVLPDEDDDTIDTARYALASVMLRSVRGK